MKKVVSLRQKIGQAVQQLVEKLWPELCPKELELQLLRARNKDLFEMLTASEEIVQSMAQSMQFLQEQATNVMEWMVALKKIHSEELEKLREELGRDDLTGLLRPNTLKRAFHRHAHEVGRTIARVREETHSPKIAWPETSILFIDVDRFKSVNDRYGHAVGDNVLTVIAQIIKGAVREDDIPARFGGDEFVVVLSNASTKEAETTAERIRRSVEAHDFHIKGLTVTVSIGVARVHMDQFPDDPNQAIEEARTRSDMAMYGAKAAGRNTVAIAKDQVSLQ